MHKFIVFILIFTFTFVEAKRKPHETLSKTTSSYVRCPTIFDRSDRARQLYLWQVFQDLKIRRNFKVADIGAGGGWLTVRLAAFVGPKGKVYAVDILPRNVIYIKEEIKTNKLNNVEAILGSMTGPELPENTLDAAIILNAYHEFQRPITMLTNIRKSMKTGARLAIMDRDNDQMRTEALEAYSKTGYILNRVNETLADDFLANGHYLALEIVVREAKLAGLTFLFSRELGGDFYLAVFANS